MMKRYLVVIINLFFFINAQNFNITFKDSSLINDGIEYNDIWGFQHNNEDYIIIGKKRGFVLYKIKTDGKSELVVYENSSNNDNSTWGEYRYYNGHIFQSTESGQIRVYEINFSAKTSTYKGAFGRSRYHNITLYNNLLIACGGSQRNPYVDTFDLNTSLTSPTKLWSYTKFYVHDLVVQDNKMYLAELYASNFAIYDISNVTTSTLGEDKLILRHHYENGFTHNLWPTPDGKHLVTTDEHSQFDHVQWWDISDKDNVRNIGKFQEGGPSIVHNAFIKNDFIYMSYYDRGLIIYDISDKELPVKIGEYDTYLQGQNHSNGQFQGAWGAYPYLDSNYVAVSDISNGLFIVEFDQNIRAGRTNYFLVDSVSGDSINTVSQIQWIGNKGIYKKDGYSRLAVKSVKSQTVQMQIDINGFERKKVSFKLENNELFNDTIRMKMTGVPQKPTELTLTGVSDSLIQLSWKKSYYHTAYKLYRSLDGTNFQLFKTMNRNTLSYNDTNVIENQSYYYRVTAANDNGDSATSNTLLVKANNSVPAKPSKPVLSANSESSIALVWTDLDKEIGYIIHRSLSASGSFTAIDSIPENDTTYTDSGLAADTRYYYKISAFNSVGLSSPGDAENVKTLKTFPKKPVITLANAKSTTEINLKWNDLDMEDGYRVYRSVKKDSDFKLITTLNENDADYTDSGLTEFTWYYYKITSFNVRGESDSSNVASVRTNSPDLTAPVPVVDILQSSELSLKSFLSFFISYNEEIVESPEVFWGMSKVPVKLFNANEKIYRFDYSFQNDGKYSFKLKAKDKYENISNDTIKLDVKTVSSKSKNINIDIKTKLTISENSFDKNQKFFTRFRKIKDFAYGNKVPVSPVYEFKTLSKSNKSIEFSYKISNKVDYRKTALYGYDRSTEKWNLVYSEHSGKVLKSALDSRYTIFAVLYDESYHFIPRETKVYPNFPNPFNPSTTIRFDLKSSQDVKLVIYNSLGQKIKTLLSGFKSAGRYDILWDGRNNFGEIVSSGVYFYQLRSLEKVLTHRMIFIK